MVSHLPLRSTFDGFLAVAAFAPMPLKPTQAADDDARPTPNIYEPPTADGGAPLLRIVAACERGSTVRQTRRARRR